MVYFSFVHQQKLCPRPYYLHQVKGVLAVRMDRDSDGDRALNMSLFTQTNQKTDFVQDPSLSERSGSTSHLSG